MSLPFGLLPSDVETLQQRGRGIEQVCTWLARIKSGVPSTVIERSATLDDGIVQIDAAEASAADDAWQQARLAGRLSIFVPASGVASRFCDSLWRAWCGASSVDRSAMTWLEHAHKLAIWPQLAQLGARTSDPDSVLRAMFGPDAHSLHGWPKATFPFHRYDDGVCCALEEHLYEAMALVQDAQHEVLAHFTMQSEHEPAFREVVQQVQAKVATAHFDVRLSSQSHNTDLPALNAKDLAARHSDGSLLFRAGGHGALLANLEATGGDVVLVKNIDNVVRRDKLHALIAMRRRLVGLLVRRQAEAYALVQSLQQGERVAEAQRFVRDVLMHDAPPDVAGLIQRLHRPWRVAGMVRNHGQPGGGPYWVRGEHGLALQIVEAMQIDASSAQQQAIMAGATHFNPVDMVLGLRDACGKPWSLQDWTDPKAFILSQKSVGSATLRTVEYPGLWNGQMAGWNTIFVEIPEALFSPVKRLEDLLDVAHSG